MNIITVYHDNSVWKGGILTMNPKQKMVLSECLRLMNECLYDIENFEVIETNLSIIKKFKTEMPKDIYEQIEGFVEKYIEPIIYDDDYFSFVTRPEFGEFNEDTGSFVICSEEALYSILELFFKHQLKLARKLDAFISNFLSN